MGYPMTFRRWVNRNGIPIPKPGDYNAELGRWAIGVNTDPDKASVLAPHWLDRLLRYESALKMSCGDLGRLVVDAQDENALCKHVAERTGVDAETVAIVLKEFLTW